MKDYDEGWRGRKGTGARKCMKHGEEWWMVGKSEEILRKKRKGEERAS